VVLGKMQAFDFTSHYRPGICNGNASAFFKICSIISTNVQYIDTVYDNDKLRSVHAHG